MRHEIRDRHLTAGDERYDRGMETDRDQRAANQLDDPGHAAQRRQLDLGATKRAE